MFKLRIDSANNPQITLITIAVLLRSLLKEELQQLEEEPFGEILKDN